MLTSEQFSISRGVSTQKPLLWARVNWRSKYVNHCKSIYHIVQSTVSFHQPFNTDYDCIWRTGAGSFATPIAFSCMCKPRMASKSSRKPFVQLYHLQHTKTSKTLLPSTSRWLIEIWTLYWLYGISHHFLTFPCISSLCIELERKKPRSKPTTTSKKELIRWNLATLSLAGSFTNTSATPK